MEPAQLQALHAESYSSRYFFRNIILNRFLRKSVSVCWHFFVHIYIFVREYVLTSSIR